MKKILFTAIKLGVITLLLSVLAIFLSNWIVKSNTKGKLYNSTQEIPFNRVGLLLGTSKKLQNGHLNLYYKYRIEAAVALYKAGKIKRILISGDNGNNDYDEPTDMKNDLIASGIPEIHIKLDYAGFRTLDSMVRSKEVFGQQSITVISQAFHNERAVYIGERKDINAIGYNAKSVTANYGLKTKIRERFARVKMMLDLTFGKKPKFLGKKISIK